MNKIDRDTIRDVILNLAETSRDDALTIWDLLDAYIQLDHEIELKTAKTPAVTTWNRTGNRLPTRNRSIEEIFGRMP